MVNVLNFGGTVGQNQIKKCNDYLREGVKAEDELQSEMVRLYTSSLHCI